MSGWFGAIGGIAGALGGFLNNNNNIDAQMEMMRAQMAFNEAEARKNREWQEKMRETSYQTGMTDMKKAGLNPLLAGNIGGAAMPSSAPATSSALAVPAQRNYLAEGISSAVSLLQALNNADLVEAQVEKTNAETKLVSEQTLTQPHARDLTITEIEKLRGETFTPEERRAFIQGQMSLQGAQASAAHSAAGASAASARLDDERSEIERIRQRHYGQYRGFPNVDQGYRVGPVTAPPRSQLGSGWSESNRNSARLSPDQAESLIDRSRLPPNPLREKIQEEIGRIIRNLGRRSVDQHGTDPYSSPSPYGQY